MDNQKKYHYTAYGLGIASSISLPQLYPSTTEPDVKIVYGRVPAILQGINNKGVCYQANQGNLLLSVEGIAKYLISNGNQIVVEPSPGCDDDSVRLFLLDVAFGALLQQRGLMVLHGSTIQTKNACICLTGLAGAGKSTIATGFLKRGYRLLTDDVCPLVIDSKGVVSVQPAYPAVKLWRDSLDQLGENLTEYQPIRPGLQKYEKLIKSQFQREALPLTHIYGINVGNLENVLLTPILGFQKLAFLKNQTYRFQYIQGLGLQQKHFQQCAVLGKTVKTLQILRPRSPFTIDPIVDLVEEDLNQT